MKQSIEDFVKVGERGQIVIPKAIRDCEGIKPFEELRIIDLHGTIMLKKVREKSGDEIFFERLMALEWIKPPMEIWKEIEKEREEDR